MLNYHWIIASVIFTSLQLIWISSILRRSKNSSINILTTISSLIAAFVLSVTFDWTGSLPSFSAEVFKYLIIICILTWTARLLYSYAYSKTTVANVTIFSTLTPVYASLIAGFMGYPLYPNQLIGILVSCSAAFIFFIPAFVRNIRADIRILPYMPVFCAFLSTIPSALSAYIQKSAITLSTPHFVSLCICLFSAIASGCIVSLKKEKLCNLNRNTILEIAGIGLLQALAVLAFSKFIVTEHPAIAQTIQRFSSILQIILAHILLGDKLDTFWHLICTLLSLLGIILILFPGTYLLLTTAF